MFEKNPETVFDIIGIGIGPFNLGLAALCAGIPELNCRFIDQSEAFNWHPGMMIKGTRMQVPYYADLVTLADPCSPFSYMAFLKAKGRMLRFAIAENYYILRTEYNEYCQWVAGQLSFLQFGTACLGISRQGDLYRVQTSKGNYYTRRVVVGVGTVPYIPEAAHYIDRNVFHSSEYLFNRERISKLDRLTIIGSGQSAAEIFYDLLQSFHGELFWFTRSDRFHPMDYSKLSLELSTPDYIDHFYGLPADKKPELLRGQDYLYRGINKDLISDIYGLLVEKGAGRVHLHPNCELIDVTEGLTLSIRHRELGETFRHASDALILATGYHNLQPEFLREIAPSYQVNRDYSINEDRSVFLQNAEQSTHGFNAADLGLGPYRNAVILNTILGKEKFKMETGTCFQRFGIPGTSE